MDAIQQKQGLKEPIGAIGSALFLLAAMVGGLILVRIPVILAVIVLFATALWASMPSVPVKAARAAVLMIVTISTLFFHRSAMLFIPMVVVMYLAILFFEWMQRQGGIRALRAISLALVLLVIGMAVWILLLGDGRPRDEFGLWPLFDFFLSPLAGKSLILVVEDHDLAQGAGGRIALFEVARSLSVVAMAVGGVYFLGALWSQRVNHQQAAKASGVVLIMTSLLLLAIVLTGFPFVHRSAFMVAALLSIAVALLVLPQQTKGSHDERIVERGFFAVTIALLVCMGGGLAATLVLDGYRAEPFLARVLPLLTVLFVVGIGFTAWYLRTRERIGFAAVLVVSVLFEVIASRAYFKPYAFMNQPPPGGVVFSHFNHQDLAAADAIARELGRGAVLVSDPKTMGLIGARSGLNSLVSYSNVNTMADDTRRELVSFLRQVLQGTPDLKICTGLRRISDAYASGQLNYGQLRLRAGEQAEMDVLEVLGYNNALVPRPVGAPRILRLQSQNEEEAVQNQGGSIVSNGTLFAVIVSPDTLDWIDHPFDPSYFPAQRHVTKIENVFQHGSSGRMIDHFFLLKLICQ